MKTGIIQSGDKMGKLEFSGSSPEEMALAKTFWQTVHLMPHHESRLVSTGIKQRLPSAPALTSAGSCRTTSTKTNRKNSSRSEAPQTNQSSSDDFKMQQKLIQQSRTEQYRQWRSASRELLEKHRQARLQKEKSLLNLKSRGFKEISNCSASSEIDENRKEARETFAEIEHFEANIVNRTNPSSVCS